MLICIACHDYRRQDVVLGAILFFLVPCHLFIAYAIELFAARQAKSAVGEVKKTDERQHREKSNKKARKSFRVSWHVFAMLHFINISANLAVGTLELSIHLLHSFAPLLHRYCTLHLFLRCPSGQRCKSRRSCRTVSGVLNPAMAILLTS